MATNLGATLSLGGEKQFQQAIRNTVANLKTLDSELRLVSAEFANNEKSQEALTKKQDILARKIDEQNKKIQLLTSGLDRSIERRKKAAENIEKYKQQLEAAKNAQNQDADAIKQAQELLDKEQAAYGRAEKAIADYQAKINNARADLIDYQNQLQQTSDELNTQANNMATFASRLDGVSEKLRNIGTSLSNAGKSLSIGVTTPIVGALGTSVKSGMNYEKSLSQVQATMAIEKTSAEMEKLKNAASEMGEQTQFSASQAAEALNYLALAGYNADEAVGTLPSVLNAALAGSMDLGTASDMITDAMAALGLSVDDADDFIDKMAVTSSKANTSVAQLGEAILTVGGTAKDLKGGVTELDAELGLLANTGIKAAEGGTHLRNIILSLQENSNKLKGFGVEVYDVDGKMNSLNDIFVQLRESMQGFTDEQKSARIDEIFKLTDLAAAKSLLSQAGEAFDELSASISNSDGAAQRMADTMADNFSGSIKELQSKVEALQNEAFEIMLPVLSDLADEIKKFVDWLKSLDDETKKDIISMAAFAAAVGPVLLVVGKLISAFGSITGAVSKITNGISKGIDTLNAFSAGLGTTTAVAGGVAAAIYIIVEAFIAFENAAIDARMEALKGSEELQNYQKEAESTVKRVNDEAEALDDLKKTNEKTVGVMQQYIKELPTLTKRLDELTAKTSRTAEEDAELKSIIAQINSEFPEMNLAIDENTGLLNLNTTAILENAKAYTAMAEAKGAAALVEKAAEEKAANQVEKDRLKKEFDEIEPLLKHYQEMYAAYKNDTSKEGRDLAETAKNNIADLSRQQSVLLNQIGVLDNAIKRQDDTIDAARALQKKAEAEYDSYTVTTPTPAGTKSATQGLSPWETDKQASQRWINRRKELDDFEAFNTTEAESYERMKDKLADYYKEGIVDYQTYALERAEIDKKIEAARKAETTEADARAAEKAAATAQKQAEKEAEAARKAAEKEEQERQKQAEKDAKEAEAEAKKQAEAEAKARLEAYQKEQSRSKKWIGYRNLYGDYDRYDTTEGDSYGRIMERAGKAYQDGILDYKSYVSEISSLTSDMADKEIAFYEKIFAYLKEQYAQGLLSYEDYIEQYNDVSALAYKAQEKMVKETQATQKSNVEKMYDAELARQKARIDQVQSAIDKEMESLRAKWDRDDRQRDLAELYKEADKYRKSVTITGQEHYQEIEKQIESLEREEQMAQLEERQAAIMEQLQKEYDAVEARKNAMLERIEENQKTYQVDMSAGIENMGSLLENIKDALSSILPKNNVTYNYITDNRTYDNQNHSTQTYNNNIADNVDWSIFTRTISQDRLNT